MTDVNHDMLLGKLLANQEAMQAKQDEMNNKLTEIEKTLSDHKEIFTFLNGQRSALIWVGSAVIAAATALGLSVNKLFMWFMSVK